MRTNGMGCEHVNIMHIKTFYGLENHCHDANLNERILSMENGFRQYFESYDDDCIILGVFFLIWNFNLISIV